MLFELVDAIFVFALIGKVILTDPQIFVGLTLNLGGLQYQLRPESTERAGEKP